MMVHLSNAHDSQNYWHALEDFKKNLHSGVYLSVIMITGFMACLIC